MSQLDENISSDDPNTERVNAQQGQGNQCRTPRVRLENSKRTKKYRKGSGKNGKVVEKKRNSCGKLVEN